MLIHSYLPIILSLLAMTTTRPAFDFWVQQPALTIDVVNIRKNSGKIVVEIYKDKSTWLKTPFQRLVLPSDETTKTISLTIPHGKYAVSIYQDVNGNGKIDQNFIGIPKEPVGFGNNYKPFGKPKFESALIDHNPTSKPEAIKLVSAF